MKSFVRAAIVGLILVVFADPAVAQSAPDSDLVRGTHLLDQLENGIAYLKPGDVSAYNQLSAKLDQARQALESTSSTTHPDYAAAVDRWNAMRVKLVAIAEAWNSGSATEPEPPPSTEPAQPAAEAESTEPAASEQPDQNADGDVVVALNDEVIAAFEELKSVPIDDFADEAFYLQWDARVGDLERRIESYPDDPNYGTVHGNVARVRGSIEAALAHHKLKLIESRYAAENLLDLSREATADEARSWAANMRRLLEVDQPRDMAEIAALAEAGAIDSQRKSSLDHWIGYMAKDQVEQKVAAAAQMLDGWVETGIRTAVFIEQTDAANPDHVANRLVGEGKAEEFSGRLQDGLLAAAVASAFDEGLGRGDGPDRGAQTARIQAAVERYRELVTLALDSVRMPEARSTDPDLLAAAAEALANPDYGVGAWRRMVINYDLQRKEKHEGEYRTGTVYDTITVYHYVWDEFQVTTIEQVGERWFMFANRLKYFHQGGPTTPTGRWILADRFQTTEILEEYIEE